MLGHFFIRRRAGRRWEIVERGLPCLYQGEPGAELVDVSA